MRTRISTLIILLVIAIVALTPTTSEASWVSELILGVQREYREAGIIYSIDEFIPEEWLSDSTLNFRYNQPDKPIFRGTELHIGVTLTTGSPDGRKFAICITDPKSVVGDTSGRENWNLPKNTNLGGMKILGTFVGKYGYVEFNTAGLNVGTTYLFVYALKGSKYEKYSEQMIPLRIAPSLPKMVRAMKDAPEPVLAAWGLESYKTLEEFVGPSRLQNCTFDVRFADGGYVNGLYMSGAPTTGRFLGVYDNNNLLGVFSIDEFDGKTVRSMTKSNFITRARGTIRCAYVVRSRVYSVKGQRELTPEERENLKTYPDSTDPRNPVYGLRNAVCEMATSPTSVKHLTPYVKNSSADIWRQYQVWTAEKESWMAVPETDCLVLEKSMREFRVVRLSAGGIPVIKLDEAKVSVVNTPGVSGLVSGLLYVAGQAARRPSTTNVVQNGGGAQLSNEINNNIANSNSNAQNTVVNVGDGSASGSAGADSNAGAGNSFGGD